MCWGGFAVLPPFRSQSSHGCRSHSCLTTLSSRLDKQLFGWCEPVWQMFWETKGGRGRRQTTGWGVMEDHRLGKAKPWGGGASDKITNQSSMKSAHDMYHNLNNLIVTSINWSILAYQKKPLVSFEYFQFLLKILLKEFALSTKFQSLFEGEYFLPG